MWLDERVGTFLAHHRLAVFDGLSRGAMAVGTNPIAVLAVALAGAFYVVRGRHWRVAIAAVAALVLSTVLAAALKAWIGRPRPPANLALSHVAGPSMPSTHAARASALAMAVFLVIEWHAPRVRRSAAALLGLAVIAIGGALVYLGVHWLTDVLVGWLLGTVVGALSACSVTRGGRARTPADG